MHSGAGANSGMVLPIVADVTTLTAVEGTVAYDLKDHCLKIYTVEGTKADFTTADLQWVCIDGAATETNVVAQPVGTLTGQSGVTTTTLAVGYTYVDRDNVTTGETLRIFDATGTTEVITSASAAITAESGVHTFTGLIAGTTYIVRISDAQTAIVAELTVSTAADNEIVGGTVSSSSRNEFMKLEAGVLYNDKCPGTTMSFSTKGISFIVDSPNGNYELFVNGVKATNNDMFIGSDAGSTGTPVWYGGALVARQSSISNTVIEFLEKATSRYYYCDNSFTSKLLGDVLSSLTNGLAAIGTVELRKDGQTIISVEVTP